MINQHSLEVDKIVTKSKTTSKQDIHDITTLIQGLSWGSPVEPNPNH